MWARALKRTNQTVVHSSPGPIAVMNESLRESVGGACARVGFDGECLGDWKFRPLCEWVTHKLLSVKRLEFPITLRDWQGLIFAETCKDRPSIIFKADKSHIRSDFFCQLASGFLSVWWVFACCVFLPRRDAIANCFFQSPFNRKLPLNPDATRQHQC